MRDTTPPPPEVIARRGANWQDQDAGDVFGIMQRRDLLPDRSDEKPIPGPTPTELKIAGQTYSGLIATYEQIIGAPTCAVARSGGRALAAEDVGHSVSVRAKIGACRIALSDLDHRVAVALSRAVAAVTHEQIEDALRWADWIVPGLVRLHERADDIRRAGRTAADQAARRQAA
ncbi:hypothetical protein E9232_004881 [Inquilinus ginsengisoli]|uniref:Uncharacterized protein n=1 Tax=Inquilinus ginsengisoli TaxID=363840 RepID=A0ABU1JUP7_9PROT|nr:hypothetical protein [Inquilinus ginsengisoli]MDR6292341.1 hypothetical protein [Inquilinus ginsengisoli]